jgi:hypothetical protein
MSWACAAPRMGNGAPVGGVEAVRPCVTGPLLHKEFGMRNEDPPARPFLGTKRALIKFAVAAAILLIFMFVAWMTMAAE